MKQFQHIEFQLMNRPIDVILFWMRERADESLYLDAPYQRGVVWGEDRQRNLIRSLLMGIPISSIITNNRMQGGWTDDYRYAVIDGKQRITSIMRFVNGAFSVPGSWFDLKADSVRFQELEKGLQARFRNKTLSFCEGAFPSLEVEEEVFHLVNYRGLRQGETDR